MDIFPENWTTVATFFALSTQWRSGPMGGVTGLDYAAIPAVLRLRGVARGEWTEVFEGLRTMESEALTVFDARRR